MNILDSMHRAGAYLMKADLSDKTEINTKDKKGKDKKDDENQKEEKN